MDFRFIDKFDEIPANVQVLWKEGASANFFLSPWWFETIADAGLDSNERLAIGVLDAEGNGKPCGILPTRRVKRRLIGPLIRSELRALTGMYSCYFRPILAQSTKADAAAEALGWCLGRAVSRSELIHLDALDAGWPALPAFERGLAKAGLIVERYDHFGSWWEDVEQRSFEDYLRDRGGALREMIRRRGRALERAGRVKYQVIAGADELAEGIATYERVYRQSWKEAEPYPQFQPLLMRNACRERALRLGICRVDGVPVAVQLWILWHRSATLLKLAHVESASKLSSGTLLTAYMIRRLMTEDNATKIDFGRGDDPYKSSWTTRREQRIGLLAANPASALGLTVLARQFASRWRRKRQLREGGFRN
jgi:CelD/BcsL family acetyltransferase involved in cellulose biosynthesis